MDAQPASPIETAARAGIDLSLLEASLSVSYDQRARQHQSALDLALEFERAGRQLREQPQSPAAAPVRR